MWNIHPNDVAIVQPVSESINIAVAAAVDVAIFTSVVPPINVTDFVTITVAYVESDGIV